jgi:hypothetical protein
MVGDGLQSPLLRNCVSGWKKFVSAGVRCGLGLTVRIGAYDWI